MPVRGESRNWHVQKEKEILDTAMFIFPCVSCVNLNCLSILKCMGNIPEHCQCGPSINMIYHLQYHILLTGIIKYEKQSQIKSGKFDSCYLLKHPSLVQFGNMFVFLKS